MTDDRYHLLLGDPHVDLKKVRQVDLWTDVLDIYTVDLVNAVTAVGTSSGDVLKHIIDKGLVGNRFRTKPHPKRPPKNGSSSSD